MLSLEVEDMYNIASLLLEVLQLRVFQAFFAVVFVAGCFMLAFKLLGR